MIYLEIFTAGGRLVSGSNDRVAWLRACERPGVLSNFGDRRLVRRIDKPRAQLANASVLPEFPWRIAGFRASRVCACIYVFMRKCVYVGAYCANMPARARYLNIIDPPYTCVGLCFACQPHFPVTVLEIRHTIVVVTITVSNLRAKSGWGGII